MIDYFWVRPTRHADWEPAVRIRNGEQEEWYLTADVNAITPAVIGPKLEAPADGK